MEWGVGTAPFDDPDYRFEPWWPGTRVLLFVEHGEVRPVVEHLADPLSAFPELRGVAELLGEDGVIIDGTLLVLDPDGRPDADLLRERLAYPEVRNGEAALVASDLVWAGGVDISRRPFAERLERLVGPAPRDRLVHGRPRLRRGGVGRRRCARLDGPRRDVRPPPRLAVPAWALGGSMASAPDRRASGPRSPADARAHPAAWALSAVAGQVRGQGPRRAGSGGGPSGIAAASDLHNALSQLMAVCASRRDSNHAGAAGANRGLMHRLPSPARGECHIPACLGHARSAARAGRRAIRSPRRASCPLDPSVRGASCPRGPSWNYT